MQCNFTIDIRRRAEKELSSISKADAQIIEKRGKKEFAVIPYEDFVHMQDKIEDYHNLRDLRRAKADPQNQQGRSFESAVKELGLKKKKTPTRKQR